MTHFSAVLLRYRHHQITGERLNFGVLAVDHESLRPALRVANHRRLSSAFSGFDPAQHSEVCRQLGSRVDLFTKMTDMGRSLPSLEPYRSASEFMASVWPDKGTRYVFSNEFAGQDSSVDSFADFIFESYVGACRKREPQASRNDRDLWRDLQKKLRDPQILHALSKREVDLGPFKHHFDFTHENGRLHIFQPLSFDLAELIHVQEKALKWHGSLEAMSLGRAEPIVSLIVAPPREEVLKDFAPCVEFLRNTSIRPKVFFEGDTAAIQAEMETALSP